MPRAKKSSLQYAEVVRTVELEQIEAAEGPALRLRLEVVQQGGRFGVRAFRHELVRVQPGAGAKGSADVDVLVLDNGIDWSGIDEATAKKALKVALRLLAAQLGR